MINFKGAYRLAKRQIQKKQAMSSYRSLYREFSDATMVPESYFIENLAIAAQVMSVGGSVVECGVWRGGMSGALCRLLGAGRSYFLFDSFEGLPPAQAIDGAAALNWQANPSGVHFYNNCSAAREYAESVMKRAGARDFRLVQGWFETTLKEFNSTEPIALLRLDADWYESTIQCLDALFDKVTKGGVILIDDYYTWDGCSRAVHDFLSRRSADERIRSSQDVCYIIKS